MTRGELLKKIARETLGEEYAAKIWKRVEFIGDIALIRTPLRLDPLFLKPLAYELLKRFPYVKSVWAALPGIESEYRLRKHVWLAGEHRSETIYREHGCLFKVDVNKVYISPSLNYEHMRIARLVGENEVVVNMFAGVGLFSIIIAKYAKPRRVYSIDINPEAYSFMVENIKLNKVQDIVIPILGDAREVVTQVLENTADRVLMPYPDIALKYIPYALSALKNNTGWIHVYLHIWTTRGEHWRAVARNTIEGKMRDLSILNYDISFIRKIRNIGPRTHQVVVDLKIGH